MLKRDSKSPEKHRNPWLSLRRPTNHSKASQMFAKATPQMQKWVKTKKRLLAFEQNQTNLNPLHFQTKNNTKPFVFVLQKKTNFKPQTVWPLLRRQGSSPPPHELLCGSKGSTNGRRAETKKNNTEKNGKLDIYKFSKETFST